MRVCSGEGVGMIDAFFACTGVLDFPLALFFRFSVFSVLVSPNTADTSIVPTSDIISTLPSESASLSSLVVVTRVCVVDRESGEVAESELAEVAELGEVNEDRESSFCCFCAVLLFDVGVSCFVPSV